MTPLAYSGMRELHLREWHCTLCDFFKQGFPLSKPHDCTKSHVFQLSFGSWKLSEIEHSGTALSTLCCYSFRVFFSSFFRVVKTVLDMLGVFRLMCDEFNKHRSSQPDDPVTQISILVGRVSFPYSASHTLT